MLKIYACDKDGNNFEPVATWTDDDVETAIIGQYTDEDPIIVADMVMECGDMLYQVETVNDDGLVRYEWYRVKFND